MSAHAHADLIRPDSQRRFSVWLCSPCQPPLPDDPATLQHMLLAALAEIERLRLQIAALQRNRFGRRSESSTTTTVQQGVEDLEQSVAEQSAAVEAAVSRSSQPVSDTPPRTPRAEPAKRNRGALPADLPRVEK